MSLDPPGSQCAATAIASSSPLPVLGLRVHLHTYRVDPFVYGHLRHECPRLLVRNKPCDYESACALFQLCWPAYIEAHTRARLLACKRRKSSPTPQHGGESTALPGERSLDLAVARVVDVTVAMQGGTVRALGVQIVQYLHCSPSPSAHGTLAEPQASSNAEATGRAAHHNKGCVRSMRPSGLGLRWRVAVV